MRPRSIPQTPAGRWVALSLDGYPATEHHQHAHQAAAEYVETVGTVPGDLLDVGRVVSTEDLLDGPRFARLVLEDLLERVGDACQALAEGWPDPEDPELEARARRGLEIKLRGAVMAYLVEIGAFPPPWYARPERAFEYAPAEGEDLAALYAGRKIRGRDPGQDAEELGPECYVLREVCMQTHGPEGELLRDYVGAPIPSAALEAHLAELAPDPTPPRRSSVCRAEGCAEDARTTRPVEDQHGQELDLELCQGHAGQYDDGQRITWQGERVERTLPHEEEEGLEV